MVQLVTRGILLDTMRVDSSDEEIEIRVRPQAPRDLAAQLTRLLEEKTGARWTIAASGPPSSSGFVAT
jgi:hypothetical protein